LPEYNLKYRLGLDQIFLFSLQYGTRKLVGEFQELVHRRGYECVLAVDVGGDIVADEPDRDTLLTPLVDFSCLSLLASLPSRIATHLAVIAPGVCGEVRSSRLRLTCERLAAANKLLGVRVYDAGSPAFQKFRAINNDIDKRTGAYSHTVKVINEIADSQRGLSFRSKFKKCYWIGSKSLCATFPVEIDSALQNRVFFFDSIGATESLRRPNMMYESVLEAFQLLRSWGACGTEIDCSFVACSPDSAKKNGSVYLLTPCCYFHGDKRRALLRYGAQEVVQGNIGCALALAGDANSFRSIPGLHVGEAGGRFLLLTRRGSWGGREEILREQISRTADRIEGANAVRAQ
jgi:hypothetical protein